MGGRHAQIVHDAFHGKDQSHGTVGFYIREILGIAAGNNAQERLEITVGRAHIDVHVHVLFTHFYPSLGLKRQRIDFKFVIGKTKTHLFQIHIDVGVRINFGFAQHRHSPIRHRKLIDQQVVFEGKNLIGKVAIGMPVESVAGDFEIQGMVHVMQPCIFDGEVVYFDGNRRRSGVLGCSDSARIGFCDIEVGRATLQKDHLSPGIGDSNFTNHNGFSFPNGG